MPATDGALGASFKVTRALQAACMIAIIGMTSNFVSQLVSANLDPPSVLIATLSIVCIAVLYCVITFILYLDNVLPFLVATIIDTIFLITLTIVSIIVGKPLSYLNCNVIGKLSNEFSSATSFASALASSVADGGVIHYGEWIGTSKATCLEMKSIWGLCIALCVLFCLSSVLSLCMWKRSRQTSFSKGEA